MQTKYIISEGLQEQLESFLRFEDVAALSQNLRRLFIDFLDYDLKTGLTASFEALILPFNSLLDLLDSAAKDRQEFNLSNSIKEHSQLQPSTAKDKVVAFLVASVSPSAIFLLYNNTINNGKQWFDLLVVIPSHSNSSFHDYEQVITMADIDDAVINVSLHKEEVIQQQLKEGHIYYSIACSKERMVYSNKGFEPAEPNKEALKALAEKAGNAFNAAHTKSDSFLHGAANYRGEKDNAMTAFLYNCQARRLSYLLIKAPSPVAA